jgi:uncharacterized membrane protein YqiK
METGLVVALVVVMAISMTLCMIILIAVYASRYKKASPSQALVVWGKAGPSEKSLRIITSGGFFVYPVVMQCAYLPLEARTKEFRLRNIPCMDRKERKRIDLELTVTYKISNDEKKLRKAAESLLHMKEDKVDDMVKKIVDADVRNLCWKMDVKDVIGDPRKTGKKFRKSVNKELGAVGMEVTTFSVRDIIE